MFFLYIFALVYIMQLKRSAFYLVFNIVAFFGFTCTSGIFSLYSIFKFLLSLLFNFFYILINLAVCSFYTFDFTVTPRKMICKKANYNKIVNVSSLSLYTYSRYIHTEVVGTAESVKEKTCKSLY